MDCIPVFHVMLRAFKSRGTDHPLCQTFFQARDDEEEALFGLKFLTMTGLSLFEKDSQVAVYKCAKKSQELRNVGNLLFMKDNKKAVQEYTAGIASAPYPSSDMEVCEDLVLGFTNRSAAYFAMKEYKACLSDVEQALKFRATDKVKGTLVDRRDKCIRHLEKKQKRASEQQTPSHEEETSSVKNEMQSTLNALENLQLTSAASSESLKVTAVTSLPQKSYGQHLRFSSASSAVDIEYNPREGRYFVASRDVDIGDVLFVEQPFASILNVDCILTHCSKCLERSEALIPCKRCEYAMYCSENCRESAWATSHSVECRVTPELRKTDLGQDDLMFLPLRMFLNACSRSNGVTGLYALAKSLDLRNSSDPIKGFDENGQYGPLDYTQLHYLHSNTRDDLEFQLSLVIGAACHFQALNTLTDIFSRKLPSHNENIPLEELQIFVAGFLLKCFKVATCNPFRVKEIATQFDSQRMEENGIGAAIYSTLSLLNHSCDPNACSTFHQGHNQVITASSKIKKGEGVFIPYNTIFAYVARKERKAHLQNVYSFDCKCNACINQWPQFQGLRSLKNPVFLCQKCHVPLKNALCTTCRKKYNITMLKDNSCKMNQKLNEIYKDIKTKTKIDHLPELVNLGKSLEEIVERPNQIFVTFRNCLKDCLQSTGNIV